MAVLQAGAAHGPALLFQTFGPPHLTQETPCSIHMACEDDPLGIHVMVANDAFRGAFYGREDLQNAFLHKHTAQLILSALYVWPPCVWLAGLI